MVLKISSIAVLFLLFSCGGSNAIPDDNANFVPREAKTIFTLHCVLCHGSDGKKGSAGAADLSKSQLSDSEMKNIILNGNNNGMMPFKNIITSDVEIDSLVKYVKTLRQ